jgi:hypothetical protein
MSRSAPTCCCALRVSWRTRRHPPHRPRRPRQAPPDAKPDGRRILLGEQCPATDADEAATHGERVFDDRGNLVKEIGRLAGISIGDESEITAAQFATNDIVVDVDCTSEYADAPKNGHFVGIHLTSMAA